MAWVNKMYRWLIEEDLSFREIADRLNEEGDCHRSRPTLDIGHGAHGSDQ